MRAGELGQQASGVAAAWARRGQAAGVLERDADAIARTCLAMARRFHAGGKLIVFGNGGTASDAQHVSVEFVHPVVVGKPALPGISLTNDVTTLTGVARRAGFDEVYAHQLRALASPPDIAFGLSADGDCRNVLRGLEAAGEKGLLRVALLGGDGGAIAGAQVAEHMLITPSDDPLVVKESHVATYHVLWELVHVLFEQPGVLEER